MKNWTQVLAERNSGRRPGFGLPTNLDKLTVSELRAEADERGIDEDVTKKDDLVKALRGA